MKARRWLIIAVLLWSGFVYGEETRRWNKVVNEDGTASTYTFKWDVDADGDEAGETANYSKITVCNNDSTDVLYADADSNASGTQNTAVNDASKSTSIPIFAGACFTFRNKTPRSTISMICTAAQTCSNAAIYAGEPL